jgi:hypothetical protein
VVRKELNREDGQRERARIYGEIAQPRSHLLKEQLILTTPEISCLFTAPQQY